MNQDQIKVIENMINLTYESMGMAVIEIVPIAPASFKVTVIDAEGMRETIVTLFLHMLYAAHKC